MSAAAKKAALVAGAVTRAKNELSVGESNEIIMAEGERLCEGTLTRKAQAELNLFLDRMGVLE